MTLGRLVLAASKETRLYALTIMDRCDIGKISVGSIEGGPIGNKITAGSRCISDKNKNIFVKSEILSCRVGS